VLTNLTPCLACHFQLVASNSAGVTMGGDQSFVTPDVPRTITGCCLSGAGQLQFQFTGAAEASYTVLCATNLTLPLSNWTQVGTVTETSAGQYLFTDSAAAPHPSQRFYRVRQP
jgi:hypothetical protein